MLLHRLRRGGRQGDQELRKRINLFNEGRWDLLLQVSHDTIPRRRQRYRIVPDSEEDWVLRIARAEQLAARGELSHASRIIRSIGIAPGDQETYQQLTYPALRPPIQLVDFTPDILNYVPDQAVQLNKEYFISNFGSARRGLSGNLSGHRNGHLKCCLDNESAIEDLFFYRSESRPVSSAR